MSRFCLIWLIAAGCCVAQDTTGTGGVMGVARTSDGSATAGVRVCVKNTGRCAVSNASGEFRVSDLRAGEYALEVTTPEGAAFTSAALEVRAGVDARVDVALPDLNGGSTTLTVAESAYVAPEEVKNSSYLIRREQVFSSAGALQDVSRYVQTLPGVVFGSDDFRNDIIVRGGSPLENLFIVDNVEIPNINAFANFASAGGTVSILDAALIEDMTFLSGGYPAPFINRASSVLQVAQREGSRDNVRGRATVGFAGAGGILEGPLSKGQGSWIVSARRTFLDLVTDDVGFGGVPVVYTFSGKAVFDLSPRDRIWAVSLTGLDRIRLGAAEGADLLDDEVFSFDIRYRGWRNATGFNWQRLFGARGVGLLGVTHSEANVNQTIRDLVRDGLPPPGLPLPEQIAASPIVFRENSREGETTFKYDLTVYAPLIDKVQAGGSFKLFRIRYGSASPLGLDSPYSAVPGLNPFDLRQRFRAMQSGAYFQASENLTSRLNMTWGARFDNYQFIDSSRISPRLGVSYRLTDKLSWRASYGHFYQQPFFLFLAAFPENRGLVPFRADHTVTGFAYNASNTLRFTVEAYRKTYRDYPAALQFPALSLASIGDTFDVRSILFPLTSAGRGRVQGIEFYAEKRFSDRWYGQANAAWSSTRQAGIDGILRPGSFDYPFVFNTVGGYRINRLWEVSARVAWLSGRPFTPFDDALSTAQRRAIFDLERVNAERLPDYFRSDIRVDRTFYVNDKPFLVFAGVQNITSRRNVNGFTWNRRANAPEPNEQLGLFPLIGIDWRF